MNENDEIHICLQNIEKHRRGELNQKISTFCKQKLFKLKAIKLEMSVTVGDVVLPGETFVETKENATDNKKIVLGNGLRFGDKI